MLEIKDKWIKKLSNKNILIWGYGKEGKSTLKFLKEFCINTKISIMDDKEVVIDDKNISVGRDYDFEEFDYVFKSPGIVLDKNKKNQDIISQTDIFVECFRDNIIGVTGTKGKSTTSSLIAFILKSVGKKVELVGNIGVPCLDVWDKVDDDTIIVFEISCHQLEYIKVSPKYAVLLNIYPEHLDHYGTFEEYSAAKKNIYRFQKHGDTLIINEDIKVSNLSSNVIECSIGNNTFNEGIIVFDRKIYLEEYTNLLGVHNRYNIAIAYLILEKFNITEKMFLKALSQFKPLPHRLEIVGKYNDILFVDDSISTIGQSTISAIKSINNVGVVLIGGMDRGIDYSDLVDFLINCDIEYIILMYASGKRIAKMLDDTGTNKQYLYKNNLQDAVDYVKKLKLNNKVCLLSPAAASYGDFINFEDRGNKFKEMVKNEK
ncbi:MAG: UDP-N-acetylmuramoyl-L-alanine--D-glutamate ligase [Anaerorhabdus sp.]